MLTRQSAGQRAPIAIRSPAEIATLTHRLSHHIVHSTTIQTLYPYQPQKSNHVWIDKNSEPEIDETPPVTYNGVFLRSPETLMSPKCVGVWGGGDRGLV
ncbi:hypothetical protein J6590_065023 [Homalodisca vitripennis]|nr:hypothetical protein J6590_065023 [Homalodisca vitripennis]